MKKTWMLVFVGVICFGILFAATPCKAASSEADLEGTWDFIYYYQGYCVRLLGVVSIDASGSVFWGAFSTQGQSIISGNVAFTDTDAGTISGSMVSESLTGTVTVTQYFLGTMNTTKNRITGTWQNALGSSGSFHMLKRPTVGSRTFSIADLEGTWNATYYYSDNSTPYSGQVVIDIYGMVVSGAFTTEGITFSSGGATFHDFDAGGLYCSMLYEHSGDNVVLEMVSTMDSAKDSITGTWADWLGYSGTVTLEKEPPPEPSGDGGDGGDVEAAGGGDEGDGGGGGCFINTVFPGF